ncbi:MAG: PorT family protein [Spirosomaceae bacterium]|nr:PorT family protein [Spirosomataceae bacterium]
MKTLRNALTVTLLVAFGFSASAQLAVGARGGATLAKTMGSGYIQNYTGELNPIVSGNAAVFLKVPIAGGLSFRPEIGYVQNGAGFTANELMDLVGVNLPLSGSLRQRMTYVQAPLLLQYEFGGKEAPVKPYIVLGPTFSYLVDGKIVSRADLLVFRSRPLRTNIGLGVFNRFDIGAAAGAGLNFDLGTVQMMLEARYDRGFTPVYDAPVVRVPVHNQAVSVMAGFAIPLR